MRLCLESGDSCDRRRNAATSWRSPSWAAAVGRVVPAQPQLCVGAMPLGVLSLAASGPTRPASWTPEALHAVLATEDCMRIHGMCVRAWAYHTYVGVWKRMCMYVAEWQACGGRDPEKCASLTAELPCWMSKADVCVWLTVLQKKGSNAEAGVRMQSGVRNHESGGSPGSMGAARVVCSLTYGTYCHTRR